MGKKEKKRGEGNSGGTLVGFIGIPTLTMSPNRQSSSQGGDK